MAAKKQEIQDPGITRVASIRALLGKIQKSFQQKTPRATLADFIRLTQLERQLEGEERPEEIVVRWEEPQEMRRTEK